MPFNSKIVDNTCSHRHCFLLLGTFSSLPSLMFPPSGSPLTICPLLQCLLLPSFQFLCLTAELYPCLSLSRISWLSPMQVFSRWYMYPNSQDKKSYLLNSMQAHFLMFIRHLVGAPSPIRYIDVIHQIFFFPSSVTSPYYPERISSFRLCFGVNKLGLDLCKDSSA